MSNASYLEYVPPRLRNSPALRDCVALFCSAWGKYRRELTGRELISTKVYGKALRSLQRALRRPDEQLPAETPGAVTVMERCIVLFDSDKTYRPGVHMKAKHDIMRTRGPPSLGDYLDLLLAMENRPTLLTYLVIEGGQNFYQTPQWKMVSDQAIHGMAKSKSLHNHDSCLNDAFEQWPVFVQEVRAIYDNPDSFESQKQALMTRNETMELFIIRRKMCSPLMDLAYESGVIEGSPNWCWSPPSEMVE